MYGLQNWCQKRIFCLEKRGVELIGVAHMNRRVKYEHAYGEVMQDKEQEKS